MVYSPKFPTSIRNLEELRQWVTDELGYIAQESAANEKAMAALVAADAALAPIYFSAHHSANQSATGAAYYKVLFDTADTNLGGYYDTVNSRFLPPAGVYRIKAQIAVTNCTGVGTIMRKNGVATDIKGFWTPTFAAGQGMYGAVEAILALNGTDYVEIYSFVYDAVAKTIGGGGTNDSMWFEGEKL